MNSIYLSTSVFLSILASGCASTPVFELENEGSFDRTKLAGNWACSMEKTRSIGVNEIYSNTVTQEYYGEDGEYVASGTIDFQVNGAELGFIVLYVEGNWIANETELMTEGERAKILALPGSHRQITRMANSPELKKSLKKAGKQHYQLVDATWLRTDDKNDFESTCITWDKWLQECSEECGDLLNAEKRKIARDRFF